MKHRLLWRTIAGCYLLNCAAAAAFTLLDAGLCAGLCAVMLALMQLSIYKRGTVIAEEACRTRETIERLQGYAPDRIRELDPKLVRTAWRCSYGRNCAIVCASAVLLVNALYAMLVLLGLVENAAFDALRMLVCFDTMPVYGMLRPWLKFSGELRGIHAAIMLLLPLAYPVSGYIGYLRGREIWRKKQQKMQESCTKGPRRIVKKVKNCKNLPQTPEI